MKLTCSEVPGSRCPTLTIAALWFLQSINLSLAFAVRIPVDIKHRETRRSQTEGTAARIQAGGVVKLSAPRHFRVLGAFPVDHVLLRPCTRRHRRRMQGTSLAQQSRFSPPRRPMARWQDQRTGKNTPCLVCCCATDHDAPAQAFSSVEWRTFLVVSTHTGS